jgi:phenylalanyl-tRNA synthetase beta chain
MKILLSWLREFVDIPAAPEEIAGTMSVRGFAVEGLERLDGEDAVVDFEITANRPDCMSVVGMAREVATAYGVPLKVPLAATPPGDDGRAEIDITIDNPELCTYYAGGVADVRIAPSPAWMQERLKASGVRPISNIVDITNYVLLELGQPMHAFDRQRLDGGQIRVRTARRGEQLRTLDGQQRELTPETLVIADAVKPVALAGVMGGADSEVAAETTSIVFESAHFDPLSVRRTSKRLGLKTEASMRFERGSDPMIPGVALRRACHLLNQIEAGRAHGTTIASHPSRVAFRTILLRREKLTGLLGMQVPDADVLRILGGLGFLVEEAAGGWKTTVHPRRVDVLREVDLIEEIARHHGFERVPVRFPPVVTAPPAMDPRITRARQLRMALIGADFCEALTFGFVGQEAAESFAPPADVAPIANPLSENFSVLRSSALAGLIDAVAHNRRREQRDVRLFEIGACFSKTGGERRTVACAWSGMVGGDHWAGGTRPVDFFDIRGAVERVCETLGIGARIEPWSAPWLTPGRAAAVKVTGTQIGALGQLAPAIAERQGLARGDAVFVAEIDLDVAETLSAGAFRVEPLPKYPSVTRDISIVVDDTLPAAAVRETVRQAAPPTLVRVREFDRYQGKGVPEGKISLSLRLTFRSLERTLTDVEVQTAMDAVLAALKSEHDAIQR